MKFPYGLSDFKQVITNGYYYCDRTDKIPLIEKSDSVLFIRPRRFGKSLVLSMLENYYDVAGKDEFKEIFGGLAIGKNPTPLKNSYFILKWDFSCVDTSGSAQDLKQSLFNHINAAIEDFYNYYTHQGFKLSEIKINYSDALYSIKSLINSVRLAGYPVYLLIDEYDNFANTVMMRAQSPEDRYKAIVHDEGTLRTLFKVIKASTSASAFARVFITGVSPVVLSDITSGYNIAKNIYFEPEFNNLCGFKEDEVRKVIEQIAAECNLDDTKIIEAVHLMRTYYNGYLFSLDSSEHIYNPTLCLYFFEQFHKKCTYPREMLDDNLATDESKLEYVAQLSNGRKLLLNLTQKTHEIAVSGISKRFGIKEMLDEKPKDNTFLISFLYYFGVLTLAGETDNLEIKLKVPNLVMLSLYVERIHKILLTEPEDRDAGKIAAKKVYQQGNIEPLCNFVENHFFKIFKNRDYRCANELTLKTAFLTLLYNDIIFIMDSETEISRRYADLTMLIRPDKRYAQLFDILIEFKFVPLKDADVTGEEARELSRKKLYDMPCIRQELKNTDKQVCDYGASLEKNTAIFVLKNLLLYPLDLKGSVLKK